MNDLWLGYGLFSNPNRSLKLVVMHRGNHWELFSDISATLDNDFIIFHSLNRSPQKLRADNPILTT